MGIKKKSTFAGHAWAAVRMALLWARKGGAFARADHKRLKYIDDKSRSDRMHHHYYLERQFSIDETPAFHFKMPRPASLRWISCIDPPAVDETNYFEWDRLENDACNDENASGLDVGGVEELEVKEEEVDAKAEEFIARFYDQMKLQRQISFLQYNEMLERSMS